MATDYSIENARLAVPYLIEYAKKGETITYGQLAAKIGRHHRAVPHLLEHLLRVCQNWIFRPSALWLPAKRRACRETVSSLTALRSRSSSAALNTAVA